MLRLTPTRAVCLILLLLLGFSISACIKEFVGGYEVTKNKVIYHAPMGTYGTRRKYPVIGADPDTFETLDRQFGRDSKHAYYNGVIIKGSDGGTFALIKPPLSKDKGHVYWKWDPISDRPGGFRILFQIKVGKTVEIFSTDGKFVFRGKDKYLPDLVDAGSFRQIEESYYFKDKTRVYRLSYEVAEADPETFRIDSRFNGQFASDGANLFYNGTLVEGVDRASHEIINEVYHRDAEKVFFRASIVSFDSANFRILSPAFSKDSDSVYWYGVKISDDVSGFEFFPSDRIEAYARDRQDAFFCAFRIDGADVETFVGLNHNYAKDKNRVYFGFRSNIAPRVIKGADPATFKLVKGVKLVDAQDRHGKYFFGRINSHGKRVD